MKNKLELHSCSTKLFLVLKVTWNRLKKKEKKNQKTNLKLKLGFVMHHRASLGTKSSLEVRTQKKIKQKIILNLSSSLSYGVELVLVPKVTWKYL
jgi:hypothetical protein